MSLCPAVALPMVNDLELFDITHSTMMVRWQIAAGASGYMILYAPLTEGNHEDEKEVRSVCVGLCMQGADYTDRKAKPQRFRRSENISLPCVTDASHDHNMILLHSRLNQCGVIHLIKLIHIPTMLSLWIVSNIYTVLFKI